MFGFSLTITDTLYLAIANPALLTCLVALAVEVPLCPFLSFYGAERFAHYLATMLLATRPR
jgi:hypothetical protein